MKASLRKGFVSALPAVLGVFAFLALWQIIGTLRLAGLSWPPLTTVLAFMADPSHHRLLGRATMSSYTSVLQGYCVAIVLGIGLGMVNRLIMPLREGLDRLIALIHATPAIAFGPVFLVALSRDQIPVAMSVLAAFYPVYVATTSGLLNAGRTHHDVFTTLGASRVQRLIRLELPAALPAILSGLKLAVPVAFIGAILGEWFGASRGLGLLMVSAMQNFQIPLLWSAVLLATISSLLAYFLMGLVEQRVARRFQ